MVELLQVSKRFQEKTILADLTLALRAGAVTCLLGPSGCGKTTLLRTAAGLLAPDSGCVRTQAQRPSFIFQEDRLLPWYSAIQNLTRLGIDAEAAHRALEAVLLGPDRDTYPQAMSGGMQRRLAIARAIAFGGDMYYLDEPLRGLDRATAEPVLAAIRAALHGKSALLITHRAEEAFALSTRLVRVEGPPLRVMDVRETASFLNVEAIDGWLLERSR